MVHLFLCSVFSVAASAEVCRPSNGTHSVECVLCTATAQSGSSAGIHYIANAWCSFTPRDGVVQLPATGWPVQENQRLTIPPRVVVDGALVIRGSNSKISGGGTVSTRILANQPAASKFTVSDIAVTDDVAVVIRGTRGSASGFEGAVISDCRAKSSATDVAVLNAGNVTVRGAVSVMTENVRFLAASAPTVVFDVETELRALGSMFVADLTAAEQPTWVATLQRANGWLFGLAIGLFILRYAL